MEGLTVSEHPPQPLYPTRILNLLGKVTKTPHLEAGALMDAAVRQTGLSNWGADEFVEPLTRFCEAVNQDTQMHFAGRVFTRKGIVKWLADRLEIEDTLRRHPEILEKQVLAPILIPGEQRAGTTLLHRLMALDDRFRVPRSWEIHFPVPPPDPVSYESDPRIKRTEALYRAVFRTCPAFPITHPMEANWPEECWPLLDRSFIRILTMLYNDVPAYVEWLLSLSNEAGAHYYRFYKKQLQILQWRFPDPRWALKSPIHGAVLGAFHRAFPDARYIMCHRDPVETIPSTCSLIAAWQSSYYETLDFRGIGRKVVRLCRIRSERLLESRRQIGETAFFDLPYSALVREPIPTLRSVYRFLGLNLTGQLEERARRFLEMQHRGRHRQHRYSLEEFGLDRRMIEKEFEAYIQRFRHYWR